MSSLQVLVHLDVPGGLSLRAQGVRPPSPDDVALVTGGGGDEGGEIESQRGVVLFLGVRIEWR